MCKPTSNDFTNIYENDFECNLCLSLLCEPVTIQCGHTFCKLCLMNCQKNRINLCPICRAPTKVNASSLPINILVQNLIMKKFSLQYQTRLNEIKIEKNDFHKELLLLCTGFRALFPNQTVHMILSQKNSIDLMYLCLQKNNQFGYLTSLYPSNEQNGTVAEIIEHRLLDDKRMHLVIKGVHRFKIVSFSKKSHKTYIAKIDEVLDIEQIYSISELDPSMYDIDNTIKNWIHQKRFEEYYKELENISTGKLAKRAVCLIRTMMKKLNDEKLTSFNRVFGDMPTQSAINFSFWLSNIVGLSNELRSRLLNTSCLRLRLSLSLFQLERIYVDENGKEQPRKLIKMSSMNKISSNLDTVINSSQTQSQSNSIITTSTVVNE